MHREDYMRMMINNDRLVSTVNYDFSNEVYLISSTSRIT